MDDYRDVEYRDELQVDKSVKRTYSTGVVEWRRQLPDGRVEWEDEHGNSGTDEVLGDKIVKRTYKDGQVIYGREQGYGRTLWSDGQLTMNRSSFGGQIGTILAGVGAGVLLGSLVAPPMAMSAAEEEELRRQAQEQAAAGGDFGGGGTEFEADFG